MFGWHDIWTQLCLCPCMSWSWPHLLNTQTPRRNWLELPGWLGHWGDMHKARGQRLHDSHSPWLAPKPIDFLPFTKLNQDLWTRFCSSCVDTVCAWLGPHLLFPKLCTKPFENELPLLVRDPPPNLRALCPGSLAAWVRPARVVTDEQISQHRHMHGEQLWKLVQCLWLFHCSWWTVVWFPLPVA